MRLLFMGDLMLPDLLQDSDAPVGGWAVQQLHLLNAVSRLGHATGVLIPKGTKARVGDQAFELIETYHPSKGIPKLRFFHPGVTSMLAGARRFGPDAIIQSCSGLPTGAMAWVAGRLGVPFVHRIASDTDADGREHLYGNIPNRLAFRYGLARAKFVVCQNDYQRSRLAERFPSKRTGILYNAIATSPENSSRRPRQDRTYIAWLAVFRRQKNMQLLSKVAKALPEVEFRVAGKPFGTPDKETAAALKTLERMKNVRFVGYLRRGEIAEFLGDAIALLCTSDYEGFSNAFLEALAEGTPVIARPIVDPDGLIARNGLGYIAEDGNDLVRGVREVCALDAERFADLSRRCRRLVEENHAPEAAAAKLIALLAPIVSNQWQQEPDQRRSSPGGKIIADPF